MRRLQVLPSSFPATRDALHRVAEQLVAPARKPDNEIALTPTPGGFGTPEFDFEGRRVQVRVEGAVLVLERDGDINRAELTSLAAGGALLGHRLLPEGVPKDESPLDVDPRAAARLADFYALAQEVLDGMKARLPAEADPSDTNLWPEHFDIAFEGGPEAAAQRANYGASPGDDQHPEPYLYVGPWAVDVEGELWNATGFAGAEMTYAELIDADDPGAAALQFFRSRYDDLTAPR